MNVRRSYILIEYQLAITNVQNAIPNSIKYSSHKKSGK